MRESVLDNTFRLLEEIGRGGFGAVYRAVRIGAEGSGPVAIKLLNKNPGVKSDEYLRFQREAVLMSQLVHSGVVTVYELGEEAGCYFIVMEFVSGPNLREHVKARGGRLPLTDILEILIQAAEALEYVHGHNIVHRDIKPQNILVCDTQGTARGGDGRLQTKLVDFGVARLNDVVTAGGGRGADGARPANEVVGTYSYMPPEATGLVDWPVDPRSDVYSLGVVAFELLAGKTPFHDLAPHEIMRAHVETSPPSIRSVRGHEVPRILEDVTRKCMEKRPEDRYQSMFALMCDLRRMQSSLRAGNGLVEDFPLASKDIGLGTLFNRVYVGRSELTESVFQFVLRHVGGTRSRLSWGMLRGGVGVGKTRAMQEVRQRLEHTDLRHLYLRFSESEQRLPFQALSLCLNDHLLSLERADRTRHALLLENVRRTLGDSVAQVAALVPVLRPLVGEQQSASLPPRPVLDADDSVNDEGPDPLSVLAQPGDAKGTDGRRFAAPSARVNQAFLELIACIAEESGHFVFLFDDVHLADSSTLALLQYMAEQVNDPVGYTVLLSVRERLPRSNLVLESFLRRLGGLRRRFQSWDLFPLDEAPVDEFLRELGLEEPPPGFVEYVLTKTGGSPLQIHALVKRMLAQNALTVTRIQGSHRGYVLDVDASVLPTLEDGLVNIEMIIAQVEGTDKRDLHLLRIAAISHEACEFDYFRMDPDFSRKELETRLLALSRRGVLEALGDASAPVQRLAFGFAHEKIRNAVLAQTSALTRREIHLRLARHIEQLYKNPRREQVLLLAKHYDGAGELVDADTATHAFLRAVRIHVRGQSHNLAKYYIEKTLARAREIPGDAARVTRLREVFEAEYSIHAAQGNLVAASDVCQQLIAITDDGVKKEILKAFWSQLLLALGRNTKAHAQAADVLAAQGAGPDSAIEQWLAELNMRLVGTIFYKWFSSFVITFFSVKPLSEVALHALALKGLAEFHGVEENVEPTFFVALRAQVTRGSPSRWSALHAMLEAARLLRAGEVERAYVMADQVQRYLQSRGHEDAVRWCRALRALWLDYPLGRTDRLLALMEHSKEQQLPTSGLLHFESGGLRSWMRLLSPSSAASRAAEAGEARRRRKADKAASAGAGAVGVGGVKGGGGSAVANAHRRRVEAARPSAHANNGAAAAGAAGAAGAVGAGRAPVAPGAAGAPGADGKGTGAMQESFLESHSARRVLDAGENGPFTSLALFSDSLRYALAGKLDPLKRATEQLRRQESASSVGEAFGGFAGSLHALVSGRHKEALEQYQAALEAVGHARLSVIALPVADGLRFAAMLLPVLAVGSQARGWPWGSGLASLLSNLDASLRAPEGLRNPRRNALAPLFEGFHLYMLGERKQAFERLGGALGQARSQKLDLLECFGLMVLGTFSGQTKLARAQEHFMGAHRLAQGAGWSLLERQVIGLAKRVKVDLGTVAQDERSVNASVANGRNSSVAMNNMLASMQRLSEKQGRLPELFAETARLAGNALGVRQTAVFLLEEDGGRGRFTCGFHSHAETSTELFAREGFLTEQEMMRLLSRNADEPVKLVPLVSDDYARPRSLPSTPPGPIPSLRGAKPIVQPPVSASATVAHAPLSAPATVAGSNTRFAARPSTQSTTRSTHHSAAPLSQPTVVQSIPTAAPVSAIARTVAPGGMLANSGLPVVSAPALRNPHASRLAGALPGRSRAENEERYLVLVAISSGKRLIGWIALPGVTLSSYSRRDAEQDLVMLGLHCGYLVRDRRNQSATAARRAALEAGGTRAGDARATDAAESRAQGTPPLPPGVRAFDSVSARGASGTVAYATDTEDDVHVDSMHKAGVPVFDPVVGELPPGVLAETCGAPPSSAASRLRVFPLPRGRVLALQWHVKGRGDEATGLVDLLARHAEFFVTSLRARQETPRLQALALRMSSDFSALFEGFPGLKSLEDLTLGFVLLDATARVSIEGVFGTERFNSTGLTRVENEFFHEVAAIRGGDKLVYRERIRSLTGECGWLFALEDKALARLPEFARADFLERYLFARQSGRQALRETLLSGPHAKGEAPRCVVLLLVNEEHDERLRAG